MLRLFILSLFAMAAFLLAAPSMQELVAHTASFTKASAPGTRTAQDKSATPCDMRISGSLAPDGCSATQTCATCNICHVCHEAALVETPSPATLTAFTWAAFPPTLAGNASVEHPPASNLPFCSSVLGVLSRHASRSSRPAVRPELHDFLSLDHGIYYFTCCAPCTWRLT